MTAPVVPPGVDPWALLGDAAHSAWRTVPAYRVEATVDNPCLFAFTYLAHHLSSPETDGVLSFARHHLDMAEVALEWRRPVARRDAWVMPRGAAKSTWGSLILPLWAAAHGHRDFCVLLADSGAQAEQRLADLLAELASNELLVGDFPHLALPANGRGARASSTQVITRGGAAFLARGLDAKALGLKVGNRRPNLIVGDDLEPEESGYSLGERERRLSTWLLKVLPMNERAAVCMVGTVTMHGAIMHDVVRARLGELPAAWLTDTGTVPHWYPAIRVDEDGAEQSYWPERHSLEWLRSIRHTRDYALNYDGRPPLPGGELWRPETFRYVAELPPIEERIISVDVAVSGASNARRHDYTALAILGRVAGRREVVVEYAGAWRITAATLLARITDVCARNSDIRRVIIETNQGGDLWRQVLSPMPPGVRLEPYTSHLPKDARMVALLDRYERGQVAHLGRHVELEDQACRYPNDEHDDLIDAVAAGVERLLADR